jgi:arginyl-tRNA--protein-N-Asp/Glu arginylyltransferase
MLLGSRLARLLQRIVEDPHSCAYLPTREASLEVKVMLDVSPDELGAMLERGWRRFGPCYFRPQCTACTECVTLRIRTGDFRPSRSQRRARNRAARLRRVVSRPTVDDERLALYARWHANREIANGWEPNVLGEDRYAVDFAFPHPSAREAAYYEGDRLVGVGLFDETPQALSAVYFYYDPELSRESLGIANVVALVEDARAANRPHVYLGYRVLGCDSLAYKAAFAPHELLTTRPQDDEQAVWRAGARPSARSAGAW